MCNDTKIRNEVSHLQQTFQTNGYPPWIVHKVLHKHRPSLVPEMDEKEKPNILTLHYIKEFSEKIECVVRPLNIRAVFKTQTTIRQKVVRVKGRPSKEETKGVIYEVPCECGAVYIGETGRNLHTRLQGNKHAVVNGDIKNGITKHTVENDHQILWEEAQVIKNEPHLTKRKVKESLLIRTAILCSR